MMAARFCPRCGKEVSSAARFCPHCGTSLAAAAPVASGAREVTAQPLETAARNTRRLLIPLAVIALAVLAIAVAVLASKLHQESLLAERSAPVAAPPLTNAPLQPFAAPPLTNAPGQPLAATPLTNAPTQPTAAQPLTNAPTTGPGQLPPDVAAYLQFLKGIETQRVALDNDPIAFQAIVGSLTQEAHNQRDNPSIIDDDPEDVPASNSNTSDTAEVNASYSNYENKWQSLIKNFQSQAPPQQCVEIANHYSRFLNGDFKSLLDTNIAAQNAVATDSNEQSGANSPTNIDADAKNVKMESDKEGEDADAALAQLCQSYNAPKPFNISPEGSAGSMTNY